MRVERKPQDGCQGPVADISVGDCFTFSTSLYQRTDEFVDAGKSFERIRCVRLRNGIIVHFNPGAIVLATEVVAKEV